MSPQFDGWSEDSLLPVALPTVLIFAFAMSKLLVFVTLSTYISRQLAVRSTTTVQDKLVVQLQFRCVLQNSVFAFRSRNLPAGRPVSDYTGTAGTRLLCNSNPLSKYEVQKRERYVTTTLWAGLRETILDHSHWRRKSVAMPSCLSPCWKSSVISGKGREVSILCKKLVVMGRSDYGWYGRIAE